MTLSSHSGTRKIDDRTRKEEYTPGTYYTLEYHKGAGKRKKETFTRESSRNTRRAALERQGYVIDAARMEH